MDDEVPDDLPPEDFDGPPGEESGAAVRMRTPVDICQCDLTVSGEDLDPDEVTRLLGCPPTEAHRAGDVIRSELVEYCVQEGYWTLNSPADPRVALEGQIEAVLARATGDPAAWARLAAKHAVELDCHVQVDGNIRDFTLDPGLLGRLARRRIRLHVCLYPEE